MFLAELLNYVFWIFLLGGFLSLGSKIWELADDSYVDNKIGGWLSEQEYVFLRVFPPKENIKSLSEMENFFTNLGAAFSSSKRKDLYLKGKWYQEFVFEFHSMGGQVGIFVRMNRDWVPIFRTALESHYPGASVVEAPDPIANWPDDWPEVESYGGIFGTEILPIGGDLFPLKSWKEFQKEQSALVLSDPMANLFVGLENVPKGSYVILQFLLRPFEPSKETPNKREAWKSEYQDLRKELTNNSETEIDDDGKTVLLTDSERDLLNNVSKKISIENMKTKIRFAGFAGPNASPGSFFGLAMSYFKQYATPRTALVPNGDVETGIKEEGGKMGYFGPWIGILTEKLYYEPEREFREREFYKAVKARSFGRGGDPFYADVESLASLIHFPVTTPDSEHLAARISTGYGDSDAVSTAVLPPANLPM